MYKWCQPHVKPEEGVFILQATPTVTKTKGSGKLCTQAMSCHTTKCSPIMLLYCVTWHISNDILENSNREPFFCCCRKYKNSLTTLHRKQAQVFLQLHYVWLHHLANSSTGGIQSSPELSFLYELKWVCLALKVYVRSKLWKSQVKIELGRHSILLYQLLRLWSHRYIDMSQVMCSK